LKINTTVLKTSLLAYLLANGVKIPHYCYHNELSIAGNCRICLIEINKSLKPTVSCASNIDLILNKNKIYYDSPLVQKSRENILEFLLLNHPLDCPICDQGGDCDLQDQSLFFGFTKRRFYKFKKFVSDINLGPIIKSVMTRCIHCTRCIRFLNEISNSEELGIFSRGYKSQISHNKLVLNELSGNIIDLCPVGTISCKNYFGSFNL
jgi:NADH dehydrogenase (ubiquinone) Fe-S protein 1